MQNTTAPLYINVAPEVVIITATTNMESFKFCPCDFSYSSSFGHTISLGFSQEIRRLGWWEEEALGPVVHEIICLWLSTALPTMQWVLKSILVLTIERQAKNNLQLRLE